MLASIYSVISKAVQQFCGEIQKNAWCCKGYETIRKRSLRAKIIDEIIPELLGGAHRDRNSILSNVKNHFKKQLFNEMSNEEILDQRKINI